MKRANDVADRTVGAIEEGFSRLNPGVNLLSSLLPAASVAAALAGIKSIVDGLAELGDKSQDLRIPAQELQAISMGAQQARVSADELQKALTTFTDVSKKTGDDAKDFFKALQNIGAGFVQAFKEAPTQSDRLRVLSQAMASTTDEVKRAQLGLTAFGSDSDRVTGFVAGLAGSLEGLVQRARDLGISIDDAMVKQAQTAQTQLGTLAQVISNELITSIGSLIPSIVELLPYLEKVGSLVRDSIASFASPAARPTSTLEAEVDDSIAAVRRMEKEIADLQKSAADNGRSFLAPFLSDNKQQIEAIQAKIDKEREFQALRNRILDERQDAEESALKPAPKPAFKPRPKLNPDDSSDAFDRTEEQITRQTALINADTIAVAQNNSVRAQLRAEFQLLNAIRKDEGEVTQEQIDRYVELRGSMSAELALEQAKINLTPAHKASFVAAAEGAATATAAYDQAREAVNKLNSASSQVGSALSSAFADAIVDGKGLGDVLTSLAKQLEKMAINSIFASVFNAPASGGLSPAASLFQGLIPKFAGGTAFAPGGMSLVGERGPEIVNLPRGSQVIPNDIARQVGSTGTAIQNTFYVSGDVNPATIDKLAQSVVAAHRKVDGVTRQITSIQREQTTGVG
ncbi:hypothetical protein [Bradyrhizobium japonicum]|uniref:hypothetical protein n=1 Tax=Bradyrhizobium japonicum TaxID=375 RepID=UPI0027154C29|nr:hypothetical protein [Bradyrhizobium japonicum]WLB14982.1 hypothetical protein QIH95_23205 [Bradyrhizobium japonicum]